MVVMFTIAPPPLLAMRGANAPVRKNGALTLSANAESNAPQAEESNNGGFGLKLAPAQDVEGPDHKGVAIVGVDPNGEAAQKGLSAGDVILDVGGKPVSTPNDVKSRIANAKQEGRKAVMMRVQTAKGEDRFVAFSFPKA